MGREIRCVPKGWQHPRVSDYYGAETYGGRQKQDADEYVPLYDANFADAAREWKREYAEWEAKAHPDYRPDYEFWEWSKEPPSRDAYRVDGFVFSPEDATCYQVYETVSEGTPVSPVFETPGQVIEWLVTQGYSPEAAEKFVRVGHAPSLVVSPEYGVQDGIESFANRW
jgi:hypothetical protein